MPTDTHTSEWVAASIAAQAVIQFAIQNDILPAHLTTDPDGLTSVEVLRAYRGLGVNA